MKPFISMATDGGGVESPREPQEVKLSISDALRATRGSLRLIEMFSVYHLNSSVTSPVYLHTLGKAGQVYLLWCLRATIKLS